MQSIDIARARANEIVSQLSADPSRRDFGGEQVDDVGSSALAGCTVTCRWTCSWTSIAE
ncbi:MAG: hypothetical protein JWM27_3555 [Gemmatimonadetes bacterium]|nr:hypothetical protein [Gemmatimonadota bacterium]